MQTNGTTRARPSILNRIGRGQPTGGRFAERTRPEADQELVNSSLCPTAAAAARAGHGAEYILSDMVSTRCPEAVSWSVEAEEYANGWFAVEPVHAHFEDGTSIAFSAILSDQRDEFIRQAVRDLSDTHDIGPDGLHVDLWAHTQGDDPRPEQRPAATWAESLGRELRRRHPQLAGIELRRDEAGWDTTATGIQRNGLRLDIDLTDVDARLSADETPTASQTPIRFHIG